MSAGGSSEPWETRPEGAHFEFVELFGGVDLGFESVGLGHGCGALAEDGGGELVAGLVDEFAGEVLAFGDDDAFGVAEVDGCGIASVEGEEGEVVDALVFAVGAVGVGVVVGEECAFDGGAGAGAGRQFGCFGEGEGGVADAAGLGEADSGADSAADGMRRGLGGFTDADEEQALGGESGGSVEEESLVGSGFEFTGSEGSGRSSGDGFIGDEKGRLRLGVFAFFGLGVPGGDDEHLCFDGGEGGESQLSLHADHYSTARWVGERCCGNRVLTDLGRLIFRNS